LELLLCVLVVGIANCVPGSSVAVVFAYESDIKQKNIIVSGLGLVLKVT